MSGAEEFIQEHWRQCDAPTAYGPVVTAAGTLAVELTCLGCEETAQVAVGDLRTGSRLLRGRRPVVWALTASLWRAREN